MRYREVPLRLKTPILAAAFACGLLSFVVPASACVNTFETVIAEHVASGNQAGVAEEIAKLEAAYRKEPNLQHTNDLAVGRLLTGRHSEAISLLEEAEKRFPGQAIVAANLGTAYELSGNDAEALRWIREGVRRDPQEHEGTEWLHIEILEAKIALSRDPEWLQKNTVLGLNFGDAEVPVMPAMLPRTEKGEARTPAEIARAISYQMYERTKFVPPPNALIADLYAARGDLSYAMGRPTRYAESIGDPANDYEEALRYGAARQALVQQRKRAFEKSEAASWYDLASAAEKRTARGERSAFLPWILGLLSALAAAAFYVWRLRSPKKA
jgi:tetratricopeptide (TPR) repeat protein